MNDMDGFVMNHQRYLTNWDDSFGNYTQSLLGVIAGLMERPEVTEEDKKGAGWHQVDSEGARCGRCGAGFGWGCEEEYAGQDRKVK